MAFESDWCFQFNLHINGLTIAFSRSKTAIGGWVELNYKPGWEFDPFYLCRVGVLKDDDAE